MDVNVALFIIWFDCVSLDSIDSQHSLYSRICMILCVKPLNASYGLHVFQFFVFLNQDWRPSLLRLILIFVHFLKCAQKLLNIFFPRPTRLPDGQKKSSNSLAYSNPSFCMCIFSQTSRDGYTQPRSFTHEILQAESVGEAAVGVSL